MLTHADPKVQAVYDALYNDPIWTGVVRLDQTYYAVVDGEFVGAGFKCNEDAWAQVHAVK